MFVYASLICVAFSAHGCVAIPINICRPYVPGAEADGALDKARKHKKRQLEDTLNLVLKKRKVIDQHFDELEECFLVFGLGVSLGWLVVDESLVLRFFSSRYFIFKFIFNRLAVYSDCLFHLVYT